jgi:transketolase
MTIDGHDFSELLPALKIERGRFPKKPLAIIARTIKGRGAPFLENKLDWHGRKPTKEEYNIILEQLNATPEGGASQ